MKLPQKQEDGIFAVLMRGDLEQFYDGRNVKWRPVLIHVVFWLAVIAIPFLALRLLPSR